MILEILIVFLILSVFARWEQKLFTDLSDRYKEDSNMYFEKFVNTKTELMKANLKISRLLGQLDELRGNK